MKLETQTAWEGVDCYSYDYFHPEYIPAIAKVADRYGIPILSYSRNSGPDWIPSLNESDRRILLTLGDSPRILDLTPQQSAEYSYEVLLFANYPG